MKLEKFLFCIILTLSLSALDLSLQNLSAINVSASTRIENNLSNLEINGNNYINLSDEALFNAIRYLFNVSSCIC